MTFHGELTVVPGMDWKTNVARYAMFSFGGRAIAASS